MTIHAMCMLTMNILTVTGNNLQWLFEHLTQVLPDSICEMFSGYSVAGSHNSQSQRSH